MNNFPIPTTLISVETMFQASESKFDELLGLCKELVEYICSDSYCEDGIPDRDNAIFEKAMTLMYGEKFWAEYNRITELQEKIDEEEDKVQELAALKERVRNLEDGE